MRHSPKHPSPRHPSAPVPFPSSPPPSGHPRWWRYKTRPRFLAPWGRRADGPGDGAAGETAGLPASLEGRPAIYHCVSRTVNRERLFGPGERERFALLMRRYEAFCQVRVLAWCILSNHFHILVEIPEPPEDRGSSWSDEEFLRHVSILYSGGRLAAIRDELAGLRRQGRDREAGEFRARFFARMWDLSAFMHDLKMRFAHWFNRRRGRDGHLWAGKFKSVLVESGRAARLVAAYIDLNPVRAGMAAAPEDYRWCGYAEALAGDERARRGVRLVLVEAAAGLGARRAAERASRPWGEALAEYRSLLLPDGGRGGRRRKEGKAEAPEGGGGKPGEAEMIRSRVRQFTEGLVVGGEEFVESVFLAARDHFGPRRRSGARRFRHAETGLRAMRDLR